MEYGVLIYRRGNEPNQQLELKKGGNALGREPTNDLVLANMEVSRFHARIICTTDECKIEDLKSTRGTSINGERLNPGVQRVLKHGDTITIGPYTLRYLQPSKIKQPSKPLREPNRSKLPKPFALQPSHPIEGSSSYWQFLPTFYQTEDEDGLLNGILLICETILAPLDHMIDMLPCYFNPQTIPESLLPWLATWVHLVLNENWPLERRRALVGMAAELYRWRGTRRGLRDYIQIYTGVKPQIIEPSQESQGSGESPLPHHVFRVIVEVDNLMQIDEALLRQIIEAEKPAHTAYDLVLRQKTTS